MHGYEADGVASHHGDPRVSWRISSLFRSGRATVAAARRAPSGIPETREEAIWQASEALKRCLPEPERGTEIGRTSRRSSRRRKGTMSPSTGVSSGSSGFSGSRKRLSIEIPVRDESEEALLEVARDCLRELPQTWAKQFAVVTCRSTRPPEGISALFPNNTVLSLSQCLSEDLPGGCVMLLGPSTSQASDLEFFMDRFRGPMAVMINPRWSEDQAIAGLDASSAKRQSILDSFETVYCFMPIMIKAFVFNAQEGALFRFVARQMDGGDAETSVPGFASDESTGKDANSDEASLWRIFVRKKNSWEAIARMPRRPSSTDIEVAFYNAAAAESPLTAAAKFLKNVTKKK